MQLPLIVAVAVVLLLILGAVGYLLVVKKNKRSTLLLTGCSNAGKTVVFSQLCYKRFADTQTSMKENVASVKHPSKVCVCVCVCCVCVCVC